MKQLSLILLLIYVCSCKTNTSDQQNAPIKESKINQTDSGASKLPADTNSTELTKISDSIQTFQICNLTFIPSEISQELFDSAQNKAWSESNNNWQKYDIKNSDEGIVVSSGDTNFTFVNGGPYEGRDHLPEYIIEGIFDSIDYVYIIKKEWDHGDHFLVSLKNKSVVELWNTPIFSPDIKYVATNSVDLMGAHPWGVQLFKIHNDSISALVELRGKEWAMEEIKWISNDALVMKRYNDKGNHIIEYDYFELNIH